MPVMIAEAGAGTWTNLVNGVTNMMELSGTMLNTILSNPVYAGLFAAGFISVALGIVSALKHA